MNHEREVGGAAARDLELLSRLLDADLPAAQERGLRQRLAREPELARRWRAMQALPGQLEDLAPPGEPPPLPVRSARRSAWPWLAAALAACLAWSALPAAAPTTHLHGGEARLHGRVSLVAAGLPVGIDGVVDVFVEPCAAPCRVGGQEVQNMNPSHAAAAAIGALVTVAVYEGSATLSPPGEEPVVLAAGQSRSVPGILDPARASRPSARLGSPVAPSAPPPNSRLELEDQVARLEAENRALRMQNQLQAGQMAAVVGEPVPWDGQPPAHHPEAFEESLEAILAEAGASEQLVALACEEFPCIAVLRSRSDDFEDTRDLAHALHEQLGGGGISMSNAVADRGRGEERLAAFSLLPEGFDPQQEPGFDARLRSRTESAMGQAEDEGEVEIER